MNLIRRYLSVALIVMSAASHMNDLEAYGFASADHWPTNGWRSTTPEKQGIDSAKLADALDYIRAHNIRIHSLLIIRNGYIVLDAYCYPYDKEQVHDVASVTKSITSALIGIAIDRGKIKSLREPVLTIFPDRQIANRDARKQRLTTEHLITMSSGLDCQFEPNEPTLRQMRQSGDWVQFMLDLPMIAEAGDKFVYCSGGMHLLSGVISQTVGMSAFDFARQTLFTPLGIRDAIWPSDAKGVSHGWGDLRLHPHDMAKIGYLWLNHGLWNSKRVVSAEWVAESTRAHVSAGGDSDYGYGWWVKSHARPFIYEAVGRGGQRIAVLPVENVIVVMTGGGFEPGDFSHLLIESIKPNKPLPANPVGVGRLARAVSALNKPPEPKSIPLLPATAETVSDRSYLLDANPLGIRSLTLRFTSQIEASVQMTFTDGRTEEHPIGLDGRIKRSPGGRYNLPVGVKGYWENNHDFILDYDEIANINRLRFQIGFEGDQIVIGLTEMTSEFKTTFEGKLRNK